MPSFAVPAPLPSRPERLWRSPSWRRGTAAPTRRSPCRPRPRVRSSCPLPSRSPWWRCARRRRGLLLSAALASLVLAAVHPTYAIFLWIPFAGFLAVRWAWRREPLRDGALALAALVVPAALYFLWLLPVVRSTASVSPGAAERARGFEHYAGQLSGTADRFSLAPEVFGRTGAVAVAALLLVPLTALASRHRSAAYVVGGSVTIFAFTLVPWLFTPFAGVVSLSQARRLAGFFPFGFSLAGGMEVLAALLGPVAAPVALASGIVLQWQFPGDFGYALDEGGPAWATWVAVAGAVIALVLGLRGLRSRVARAALASALLLLPTYLHGLSAWSASSARPAGPLTPGLVAALRTTVPAAAIVYADLESSYRIAAAAPVYICNAPPGHVATLTRNHPYARRDDWRRFNRTGDLGIPGAAARRGSSSTGSGSTPGRSFRSPTGTIATRSTAWPDNRLSLHRQGCAPRCSRAS